VLELYGAVERHPELISWRNGRCLPYGDGVTFWALGEMVKAQAGILEGDEPPEAEGKLTAVVDDPWIESHLRPLVGLGGGSEAGGDAREEAFTAWRRFFEGLADERPLVLVFEDLHWADDHLLDFVDHLVEWASGVPLLVVGTARPELLTRRPDWGGGKPNALTVSLSPLSDEDTARLLRELLGAALPAETQVELLGRAGGNPLYAEEFARMLRDRGAGGEIPETVQGLIAARIDLLEPDQKALLQDAAVIGKRFWSGALASLAGIDAAVLERRLHDLERREFVRRERSSSVVEENEYVFRHLLVRDVAYGQIPRADRAAKHLAAGGWFELLGRREDHAEMLAHHYLQALELRAAAGGSVEPFAAAARQALTDAGERAFALRAYDAAARFFRAALDLPSDEDLGHARLVLRLGRALFLLGEPDIPLLEQAREELLAAGDVQGAAEADTTLGEYHWMAGDRDPAFASLGRARLLVDDLPPSATKARVTALASRFNMLSGNYAESIRLGEEALEMARQLGLREIEAAALVNISGSRGMAGENLTMLEQAIAVAREANSGYETCRAIGNLASQYWVMGELSRAASLWREAEEESERYGQKGSARWLRGLRAKIAYELGNWDYAYAEADAFIAEVEGGSPHYLAPESYLIRAKIHVARSEIEGGDVDRGVELARRAKDPQILYEALGMAAHVLDVSGEDERALALAEEVVGALGTGERLGFGVVIVHLLAWPLTRAGRGDEVAGALEDVAEIPWARVAIAVASSDARGAAEILAGMGAAASEAYCRMEAARAGDLTQLEPALAFYRSVGATRYVREGESLLAASA
jgi:tetratricopeptide (TPR) repeat protein